MTDDFNSAFEEAENMLRNYGASQQPEASQPAAPAGQPEMKQLKIIARATPCATLQISDGYEILITMEKLAVADNEWCACTYLRKPGTPGWMPFYAGKMSMIFGSDYDCKGKKDFAGDEPIRIFDACVRCGAYENAKTRVK